MKTYFCEWKEGSLKVYNKGKEGDVSCYLLAGRGGRVMRAKLMRIMALLVFVASLLVGTGNKAEAVVAVVEPPAGGVAPGAVVIRPVSPFPQPPFIVRPPFAVQPAFKPFFLRLPGLFLAPSLPVQPLLDLNALFQDEDFLLGVGVQ